MPNPAHLITAHLRSKLLTFPRAGGSSFEPRDEDALAQVSGIVLLKRVAEAVTLLIHASGLLQGNPQTPLLLLGDFNDVLEAQTSLLLAGPKVVKSARSGDNNRLRGMTSGRLIWPR